MKFRLKRLRNRIAFVIKEKYYLSRKKLSKRWERFLEKGHEKMTVMFIPHNEKKIFNFQISKFTVLFFIILFFVIVSTSAIAVIKNAAVKREEQRLLMTYEDTRSQLLRYEKFTGSMQDILDEIKPEVEELYELSAGAEDVEVIWKMDDFDKEDMRELRKIKNILPDEIFTIKEIQKDLVCTTNTIRTVKNFVDVRSKVINDTPSIISNQGHITSLFGWRRSPFGYGRDFHTGIDIAAAGGTPVRATAPGTVVSAGWGGGYGNMIRIRHKYGFETIYGHCSSVACGMGSEVKKGQIVGYVGMTGNATGNHCHYEIRLGGVAINPYPYMSRIW